MIAALDATPLTLTSGGLARYASELSLALARQFPDDRFVLVSDQPFALPESAPPNLTNGGKPGKGRWWLHGVREAIEFARAEIFHGTNFEVPYIGSTPAILTIHDLSPWKDPAWHAGPNRVRRRTPWLVRLRRAKAILTVSEAVRREIVTHFGIANDLVRAIPLAAASHFRPVDPNPDTPSRPYFLFTGTLEPRKNLAALIEAWKYSGLGTAFDLLIAGRTRADFARLPDTVAVRYLGEVPDDDLPRLYSGALAFVYPSHYEGFGLPVLEAMQCGCPVIASRDPALLEVSGEAAIHAASTQELVQVLRALAENVDLRSAMRQKGLARAACFSWERTARETHALYREVLA